MKLDDYIFRIIAAGHWESAYFLYMMKSTSLVSLLLCAGLSAACGGHHDDDKVWTKEELHELEMKWGTDVRILALVRHL